MRRRNVTDNLVDLGLIGEQMGARGIMWCRITEAGKQQLHQVQP